MSQFEITLLRRCEYSQQQALAQAAKKLRLRTPGHSLCADLYHHPFMGRVCTIVAGESETRVHTVVDLVSGRAFLTQPWRDEDFYAPGSTQGQAAAHHPQIDRSRDPQPLVNRERADLATRDIVHSLVVRRRRWQRSVRVVQGPETIVFGKPNWWITGSARGRVIEMIIDALTGSHYAFRA